MIYVTLGTMFLDFPRLVHKMDAIAQETGEQVIIQLGMAETVPQHCAYFRFKSQQEVLTMQEHARVIVGHAGIGVTLDALRVKRPLLLVPRLKQYQEHMNDHQLEIAEAVQRRGWGKMILDIDELDAACAHPPQPPADYQPNKAPLIAAVRRMVERVAEGKR